MNSSIRALTLVLVACVLGGCANISKVDTIDVAFFQPAITQTKAPDDVRGWRPKRGGISFEDFQPIVPAFNGKGFLLASWNPQKENAATKPTFIILHGGHGAGNIDYANAKWARDHLGANVLILDSFWSRGITENWKTITKYGANMRTLDTIAAARFVADQGMDPKMTFILGGSQGGWTVLRTMTESQPFSKEVSKLIAGGIALYPNCADRSAKGDVQPTLGTKYVKPVIVFTGTKDDATPTRDCDVNRVLRTTYKWVEFEGATHAWEYPTNGVGGKSTHGECTRAQNVYNKFAICHDANATKAMYKEIEDFVNKFSKG